MLDFNIVDLGGYCFRCVLGETVYFDFSVSQLELFGYDSFFEHVKENVGASVKLVESDTKIGEVASIRYLKPYEEVWILIRNGIRGELYAKSLGV